MNGSDRQKWLMVTAAAALALLVFVRVILAPSASSFRRQGQRLADLRASVDHGKFLLEQEEAIRRQWADLRARSLPGDLSVAENLLLKSVAEWVRTSRISLTGLTPRWRRNPDGEQVLECTVNAKGSLRSVTRFIYEFEVDALPLRLEQCEISSRTDRGNELTISAKFSCLRMPKQDLPAKGGAP